VGACHRAEQLALDQRIRQRSELISTTEPRTRGRSRAPPALRGSCPYGSPVEEHGDIERAARATCSSTLISAMLLPRCDRAATSRRGCESRSLRRQLLRSTRAWPRQVTGELLDVLALANQVHRGRRHLDRELPAGIRAERRAEHRLDAVTTTLSFVQNAGRQTELVATVSRRAIARQLMRVTPAPGRARLPRRRSRTIRRSRRQPEAFIGKTPGTLATLAEISEHPQRGHEQSSTHAPLEIEKPDRDRARAATRRLASQIGFQHAFLMLFCD